MTQEEKEEVVANCDNLKTLKYSPNLPFAFAEHGAVMLASVLNSERSNEVNIQIVRIFTKMREMLLNHKDVLLKIEQLEKRTFRNTVDIQIVFNYIKELITPPEQASRKKIGFKRKDEQD